MTGCRITDGGTLANFPVKYLDNEDMRPMYFSHAKTKLTTIYGLGLKTYITETQEQKKLKDRAKKKLLKRVGKIVKNSYKCSIISSYIKQKIFCCIKPH